MNTGAFGENFPYSNFHDLNMDWIIKIAKDFLDQYTNIQQVIADGLTSLDEKTTESLQSLEDKKNQLENLLDQWYTTHSQDIANELASALASINTTLTTALGSINTAKTDAISTFNTNATAKGQETLESIPDDYTSLANSVDRLKNMNNDNIIDTWYQGGFTNAAEGRAVSEYILNDSTGRIRNLAVATQAEDATFVKAPATIKITPQKGYKFAVQVIDATTRVGVYAFEARITNWTFTRSSDFYIAIWIGKTDDSTITPAEYNNVKIEFMDSQKQDIDELIMRVQYLKKQMNNIMFENAFRWDSEYTLNLPNAFASYPFYVYLSKAGNSYGYRFDRHMLHVNQTVNYKTYYVSVDGNDDNSGVSPASPFRTLDKAFTMTDIGTLIIEEGIYVKAEHWHDITIDRPINIIGNGCVIIDAKTAGSLPLQIENSCYIENICFYRGYTNLDLTLQQHEAVFNRCIFLDSLSSMGLQAKGGHIVMLNCCVVGSYGDGFNYHTNGNYAPQVLEIGCFGYNCGLTSPEITHNASTIHDPDSRIIRIGCEYHSTKGTVIADADSAISVNVACISYSQRPVSSNTRCGNYGAFSGAIMYLYGCDSSGSMYDIIADYSTIYTNETYPKELTVNDGTIVRL